MKIKKMLAKSRSSIALLQKELFQTNYGTYRYLSRNLQFPVSRRSSNVLRQDDSDKSPISAAMREIEHLSALERSWTHELLSMHASLSHLGQALNASIRSAKSKRGPSPRDVHHEAIRGLWRIWFHATENPAARTNDRDSPFYEFVHAALKMVWPRAPAASGLIDRVCTQMRRETRELDA